MIYKHYAERQILSSINHTRRRGQLMYSGRVIISCSINDTYRVSIKRHRWTSSNMEIVLHNTVQQYAFYTLFSLAA